MASKSSSWVMAWNGPQKPSMQRIWSRVWKVSRGVMRKTRKPRVPDWTQMLWGDLPGGRGCGGQPTVCPGSFLGTGTFSFRSLSLCDTPRPDWGSCCDPRDQQSLELPGAWRPGSSCGPSGQQSEAKGHVVGPSPQTWGCRRPGTPLRCGPASCSEPARHHQTLVVDPEPPQADGLCRLGWRQHWAKPFHWLSERSEQIRTQRQFAELEARALRVLLAQRWCCLRAPWKLALHSSDLVEVLCALSDFGEDGGC